MLFERDTDRKKGFTLAEALILLLISALILVATMPVLTKKKKRRMNYKYGPPGGWVCKREEMPCTLEPPAKAKNFAVYFNNELIPTFSAVNIGTITISPAASPQYEERTYTVTHPPSTEVEKGDGWHDFSWDVYYNGTITEADQSYSKEGWTETRTETVLVDAGGCGDIPSLYNTLTVYRTGTPRLSGTFCTGASMIRIVY